MRVLLDTCVILDAMQNRGKFAKCAQALLVAAANETFEGCASSKQICDVYYILHKVYHSNKKCRDVLANLFDVVEVIGCSASSVMNARISPVSDFEDAVLIECAKEAGCSLIATSNLSDFKNSEIDAVGPKQACQILGIDPEYVLL